MKFATDCKYFEGDRPCVYHKKEGVTCTCDHYEQIKAKILIIKLGEIGDVIRTTPILNKLRKEFPSSEITWITNYPEVLPNEVDKRLKFNENNALILQGQEFDLLLNFDKERESCSLTNLIKAKKKKGFHLVDGHPAPIDKDSQYKYEIGLDDNLSKTNKLSYPEQIFQMAGYKYNKERYIFDNPYKKSKKVIGLNTGCGVRWRTRLWDEQNWVTLAKKLRKKGYSVLLLGGEEEDKKNTRIAKDSGAMYLGNHPISVFVALVNLCDVVVTAITMAMHIALALEKKVIVFNHVFNTNEFELYGLGIILEPPHTKCIGTYKTECEQNCMEQITPDMVIESIEKVL